MDVALDLFQQICAICLGILLRSGPFLKEAIYQDLLIYELRKLGIERQYRTRNSLVATEVYVNMSLDDNCRHFDHSSVCIPTKYD